MITSKILYLSHIIPPSSSTSFSSYSAPHKPTIPCPKCCHPSTVGNSIPSQPKNYSLFSILFDEDDLSKEEDNSLEMFRSCSGRFILWLGSSPDIWSIFPMPSCAVAGHARIRNSFFCNINCSQNMEDMNQFPECQIPNISTALTCLERG